MVARPALRARRLRRRLRGQHEGREVARHRRAGSRGAAQPHPSWRLRLRSADRRRRGHPGADARRVPPPRSQGGAHRAARRGRVRRRHGVPARARCAQRNECQKLFEKVGPRGGAEAARLAARARRSGALRSAGAQRDARDPPDLHRAPDARTKDQDALERKLYVIRKRVEQLVRTSGMPDSERFYVPSLSSRTIVYKGLLLPEQIPAFYHDLADPLFVSRAGAGPPALPHQHVPVLGPRPPVPLHRAQRRDQHAARQRELDARAPGDVRLAAVRRRHRSSSRSSTRAPATRGSSTTRSSCSCTPAGRCRTRS